MSIQKPSMVALAHNFFVLLISISKTELGYYCKFIIKIKNTKTYMVCLGSHCKFIIKFSASPYHQHRALNNPILHELNNNTMWSYFRNGTFSLIIAACVGRFGMLVSPGSLQYLWSHSECQLQSSYELPRVISD